MILNEALQHQDADAQRCANQRPTTRRAQISLGPDGDRRRSHGRQNAQVKNQDRLRRNPCLLDHRNEGDNAVEDGIGQRENQAAQRDRAEEGPSALPSRGYSQNASGRLRSDERIDAAVNAGDDNAQNRERPSEKLRCIVWYFVPADRPARLPIEANFPYSYMGKVCNPLVAQRRHRIGRLGRLSFGGAFLLYVVIDP